MAGLLEKPSVTARQNIERVLTHLGLTVDIVTEEPDRIYGWPRFDSALLRGLGWTEDPKCLAKRLHAGAVESYREPGAVMPCMQITFLDSGMVDVDLDLANPLGGDVASTVIHTIEFLWHWLARTKSNPRRIASWLDRRFANA